MNRLKGLLRSLFKETFVGLDIGEDYISAARGSVGKNGLYEISDFCFTEIEPGLQDGAIASVIGKLWLKHNINTHLVYSCFRSTSLNVKYFKYPDLSEPELRSTLLLEAEHTFQRPREELDIDWQLCGKSEGLLVAAPKEDVNRHTSILRTAGLYPAAVDAGCVVLASLYLKLKSRHLQDAECVINANNEAVDIAVIFGKGQIYPRSIYSGSVPLRDRPDFIVENIDELLRYCQFKLYRQPVKRLVMTGRLSSKSEFMTKLKNAVNIPVELWNPLKDVKLKAGLSGAHMDMIGPVAAVSLGLALRDA